MFRIRTMIALVASIAVSAATGYTNTIVTSDTGVAHITLSGAADGVNITTSSMTFSLINKVKPVGVAPAKAPATSLSPIHLVGTAAGSTGSATQTIVDGNDTISIVFTLNAVVAHSSTPLPAGSDYLVMTGKVTSLTQSIGGPPGTVSTAHYDWTHLVNTTVTSTVSGNYFTRAFGHTDVSVNATATFTQTNEVPEPSTLGLALFGAIGAVVTATRRRKI